MNLSEFSVDVRIKDDIEFIKVFKFLLENQFNVIDVAENWYSGHHEDFALSVSADRRVLHWNNYKEGIKGRLFEYYEFNKDVINTPGPVSNLFKAMRRNNKGLPDLSLVFDTPSQLVWDTAQMNLIKLGFLWRSGESWVGDKSINIGIDLLDQRLFYNAGSNHPNYKYVDVRGYDFTHANISKSFDELLGTMNNKFFRGEEIEISGEKVKIGCKNFIVSELISAINVLKAAEYERGTFEWGEDVTLEELLRLKKQFKR